MAQQFYTLRVKDISKTTDDCSVVTFDVTDDLKETFAYVQGQYLTLKADVNGEELRRSYSLCSSPLDGTWKVAVKKIEDGRFSTFVNEVMKAGDQIEVMPPNGRFYCDLEPEKKKRYVAFAAGSGITPIHSIIKTHLHQEDQSHFTLFYLNRSVQSIILREEIEGLKNQFLNRFELFHFLTREFRDSPLFDGRITTEKLNRIQQSLLDFKEVDEFFICGPTEMIFMIRDFLTDLGVVKEKIHFELFNTPTNGAAKKRVVDLDNTDSCKVSIVNNETTAIFEMGRGGETVLDAALRNHADLPFACKGGVCCTCRAKLVDGEVEMEVNYALEQDELDAGYILTCQSVPTTEKIIVDFDQQP